MATSRPLEGEHPAILPPLQRRALSKVFMNPDQTIDAFFQPETILVFAVVSIKHARVSLGCKNIRVSEQLVSDNRSAGPTPVRVMILNKCHCAKRIDAHQPRMIQRGHAEAIR